MTAVQGLPCHECAEEPGDAVTTCRTCNIQLCSFCDMLHDCAQVRCTNCGETEAQHSSIRAACPVYNIPGVLIYHPMDTFKLRAP